MFKIICTVYFISHYFANHFLWVLASIIVIYYHIMMSVLHTMLIQLDCRTVLSQFNKPLHAFRDIHMCRFHLTEIRAPAANAFWCIIAQGTCLVAADVVLPAGGAIRAPPNPSAGFEGPLRGGGEEKWKKAEKKEGGTEGTGDNTPLPPRQKN